MNYLSTYPYDGETVRVSHLSVNDGSYDEEWREPPWHDTCDMDEHEPPDDWDRSYWWS